MNRAIHAGQQTRTCPQTHELATFDTPEGVAWRYGAPCIGTSMHPGMPMHTRDVVATAEELIMEGWLPTKAQVRAWLPKPFEMLERLGMECTLDNMLYYFRVLHRTSTDTPTHIAKITSTRGIICVVAIYSRELCEDALQYNALNVHGLDVHRGDTVFVHANTIAEKAPPEYW